MNSQLARKLALVILTLMILGVLGSSIVVAQGNGQNDTNAAQLNNRVYIPLISFTAPSAALDFASLSEDLLKMESLFSGGSGQPVIFETDEARLQGFHPESIKLAEELAEYTNALVIAAQEQLVTAHSASVSDLGVDASSFPAVAAYFAAATENKPTGDDRAAEGWCHSWLSNADCSCGHWWYPQPNRVAPWKKWTSSNPANTLGSWGYHETPGWAGGGWTRAQTYYPSRCGNNTFRDHAYIVDTRTIREQNYSGFTPRGEPNPEFWAGGPWPYATWPAYVHWWHANY